MLEFIDASVVEPQHKNQYFTGIYMLLEFTAAGDLFDKIGGSHTTWVSFNVLCGHKELAPNVGVGEDDAHFYFAQLVDCMVCSTFCTCDDRSA
jgi:hypothetical protein